MLELLSLAKSQMGPQQPNDQLRNIDKNGQILDDRIATIMAVKQRKVVENIIGRKIGPHVFINIFKNLRKTYIMDS